MSLAATNMRGLFLNCRFAVNGIQKAFRSFGVGFAIKRHGLSFAGVVMV